MRFEAVTQIPVTDIEVAPQIRQFSWGDIEELSRMIASHGYCQPIIVAKTAEGSELPYRLVAGERRLRAVRDALKWPKIPAQVVKSKAGQTWIVQLQENLGREELHWLEVARSVEQWLAEGTTRDEIAQAMGRTPKNTQALLQAWRGLAPESREMLFKGRHRPPLDRALIWAAWVNKPERQKEEIEKWLGLQKSPKPRKKRCQDGPIPRSRVERLLARAVSRRAHRLVLQTLRYLLGQTQADPWRNPKAGHHKPRPEEAETAPE